MATIPFGGILSGSIAAPLVAFSDVGEDWRTRLTVNTDLLGGPVLSPLAAGKGIIFPYTPTLFVQHNAAYGAAGLTHTNYDHPTFESHQIGSIQITGQFTANSSAEADYLRGVLHFLRTVTKMFFGLFLRALRRAFLRAWRTCFSTYLADVLFYVPCGCASRCVFRRVLRTCFSMCHCGSYISSLSLR